MNIKDIAKIAGVSATTVSKILNHKDKDISEDTRKKVLDVIKEYQYTPFSKIRQNIGIRSRLLGVVISRNQEGLLELLDGIETKAEEKGYSVIICNMKGRADQTEKHIKVLLSKNVEGILLVGMGYPEAEEVVVPVVAVNAPEEERERTDISYIFCDMKESAQIAVARLLEKGHRRIGCLTSGKTEDIEKGYIHALKENQIPLEPMHIYRGETAEETANVGIDRCQKAEVTALVCSDIRTASCVYRILQERGTLVPNDMSLVLARDDAVAEVTGNGLCAVHIPDYEMGESAAEKIICDIEEKETDRIREKFFPIYRERSSVAEPPARKQKEKIVVVGSMNVDITITVPVIPMDGETLLADRVSILPGGKGANQAVGAGRLGGLVYMIGRLGNDSDGRTLYNSLLKHDVRTDGVVFDAEMPSGKAYINVAEDGESTIVVYSGANQNLDRNHIRQFRGIFSGAEYCLLSMEIPDDTVLYTAELCKREGVKVILKPSGAKAVKDELLEKIAYFIPNEKELQQYMPGEETLEEKAWKLLDKGVENVIITLGRKGCYFRNREFSKYFPSADFTAIDTTGGADAFISALAVYLSEGNNIFHAIGFATYAAGISITREGAQPSLPDRIAVDVYQDEVTCRFGKQET